MADLTPNINTAATQPAEAEVDNQSVKARTMDEMIAADRYLQAAAAAKLPGRGLRFSKVIGPRQVPIDNIDGLSDSGFGFGNFS
jgi:hypothetical protein